MIHFCLAKILGLFFPKNLSPVCFSEISKEQYGRIGSLEFKLQTDRASVSPGANCIFFTHPRL